MLFKIFFFFFFKKLLCQRNRHLRVETIILYFEFCKNGPDIPRCTCHHLGYPDPTGARQPDQTVRRQPDSGPEPKVLSVGDGFPFSKTDTDGSSGGFASPKPVQPEPDRSYKKSGQILKKQARSGEISTRSSKISTRSGYIWWDLARSGQTQQFLAKKKNADFRKNQVSIENFPYSGKMF